MTCRKHYNIIKCRLIKCRILFITTHSCHNSSLHCIKIKNGCVKEVDYVNSEFSLYVVSVSTNGSYSPLCIMVIVDNDIKFIKKGRII